MAMVMRVKDIKKVIKEGTKVIYEDFWTGKCFSYVDGKVKVENVLPVDSSTIKVQISS